MRSYKLITEIGLTTLRSVSQTQDAAQSGHQQNTDFFFARVGDIADIEPGPYAQNWVRKMKHCEQILIKINKPFRYMLTAKDHIRITRPYLPQGVRRRALFAKTQVLSPLKTRIVVKNLIRSLSINERVVLVGHSILGDVMGIQGDHGEHE